MRNLQGPVFRFASIAALTLASFATSAFAQQQPSAAPTQPAAPAQAEPHATNAATATKATMYVYRLRNHQGMFGKPSVYIDEKELARIENGRFFVVHVDPGRHLIRSLDKAS